MKLAQSVRREVAVRHGAAPGETTVIACSYCGEPGRVFWFRRLDGEPYSWFRLDGLTIDHIIPRLLGGSDDPDNLTIACVPCNARKGFRLTPRELQEALA